MRSPISDDIRGFLAGAGRDRLDELMATAGLCAAGHRPTRDPAVLRRCVGRPGVMAVREWSRDRQRSCWWVHGSGVGVLRSVQTDDAATELCRTLLLWKAACAAYGVETAA